MTNRGIWQRALLLNNKLVQKTILFVLAFAAVLPVFGNNNVAFLVKGPIKEPGLPFIYPNAMETYKGIYRYGDQQIIVFFTPRDFDIPKSWEPSECGMYRGFVFKEESTDERGKIHRNLIFLYKKISNNKSLLWSVFISFQNTKDCAFTETFLNRLEYFQRDYHSPLPPLFPAVVEIKK